MLFRDCLKRLIALTILVSVFSTSAIAQVGEFTRFETKTGEPVKLSVFQEIPGFRPSLVELDIGKGLIELDGEWNSMSDTDVWVFFLKNETEASLLPAFILDILRANYDGSRSFSITAEIEVDGVTNERLLYFLFLEKFRQSELPAIGCDTATFLYFQFKRHGIQSIQDAIDECYAD